MTQPKHLSLVIELERDILAGRYGIEGGLPTASELAQTRGMSINTVKTALAVLEAKGLLEKRGTGYYVGTVPTLMTQYLPPTHVRVRDGFCSNIGTTKRVALPAHLSDKLGIDRSFQAVYRMQLSGELAEGSEKPLQITHRYYAVKLTDKQITRMDADATYDPMWNDASTAAELMSHDEVSPRMATDGERDLLALPENTPVLSVLETIKDQAGSLLTVNELVLSPRSILIFDYPFLNRPTDHV